MRPPRSRFTRYCFDTDVLTATDVQVPTIGMRFQSHVPHYADQHHVVSLIQIHILHPLLSPGMEHISQMQILTPYTLVSYTSPLRSSSLGLSPTSSPFPLSSSLCSSSSTQDKESFERTDWWKHFSRTRLKMTWTHLRMTLVTHVLNPEEPKQLLDNRPDHPVLSQHFQPCRPTQLLHKQRPIVKGGSVCHGFALIWLGVFVLSPYLCLHSSSGLMACLLAMTRHIDG